MNEEKKNIDKERGKSREGFIKSLMSGSLFSEKLILANLAFVGLLTFLGAIYIANRFHSEKIIRRTDELQKIVKELRAEAMSTSSDLMYISKQSEVSRLINQRGLGLEELTEPPYKLIVKD